MTVWQIRLEYHGFRVARLCKASQGFAVFHNSSFESFRGCKTLQKLCSFARFKFCNVVGSLLMWSKGTVKSRRSDRDLCSASAQAWTPDRARETARARGPADAFSEFNFQTLCPERSKHIPAKTIFEVLTLFAEAGQKMFQEQQTV